MKDAELLERLRDLGIRSASVAADRIEAMTAERDEYKRLAGIADTVARECKIHEARIELLLRALTFYADEENYRGSIHTDACGCCSSWYEPKIHIDGEDSGNIARAAIAALNTGKADT